MRRADLEHVIRAAAVVAGEDEIVIVGSQAILGQFPDAPAALLASLEADLFPRNNPEKAEKVDGALGDGSQFHAEFGYYAHGVGPETAKLPGGWEERLVELVVPRGPADAGDVRGLCLEVHDLVISKCAASRDRDWEYVRQAIAHKLVDVEILLARAEELPVSVAERTRVKKMVRGILARVKNAEGWDRADPEKK
ncbi:MAG: DUF6036 family nucleotidyltransferase [Thermoleophilaceae bacterium]